MRLRAVENSLHGAPLYSCNSVNSPIWALQLTHGKIRPGLGVMLHVDVTGNHWQMGQPL